MHKLLKILLFLLCVQLFALSVFAPAAFAFGEPRHSRIELLAATSSAGEGNTLDAVLQIDLAPEWKTYWRFPGQAGEMAELNWLHQQNISAIEVGWPAPQRFDELGLVSYGYGGRIFLPLRLKLTKAGAATELAGEVTLFVCHDICVPETHKLSVAWPAGAAQPTPQAELVQAAWQNVPQSLEAQGWQLESVALLGDTNEKAELQLKLKAQKAWQAPDVFVEGPAKPVFAAPKIERSQDGLAVSLRLPLVQADSEVARFRSMAHTLTITDGAASAVVTVPNLIGAAKAGGIFNFGLLSILLLALLGGLILNLMPCVLPVLSLKILGVLQSSGKEAVHVRRGFLASAAGIMTFFLLLSLVVMALQAGGQAVGWGWQFHSPLFVLLVLSLCVLFAANLLGWLHIRLPYGLTAQLPGSAPTLGARPSFAGEYVTGLFAALLATPCSAPFVGTAVAFALTQGSLAVVLIFSALGLGLALPYLLIALWPKVVCALPRPGAWMITLERILALLLLLTAVWLLYVLWRLDGWLIALGTLLSVAVLLLALRHKQRFALGLLLLPLLLVLFAPKMHVAVAQDTRWQVFSEAALAQARAEGRVVLVDVTAAWCITCQYNKRVVLSDKNLQTLLFNSELLPLQADWTAGDAAIGAYLASHGRYGIPFNVVYGPKAPDGIVLPELLTVAAVQDALAAAGLPLAHNAPK